MQRYASGPFKFRIKQMALPSTRMITKHRNLNNHYGFCLKKDFYYQLDNLLWIETGPDISVGAEFLKSYLIK